jgi:murein DD-endopeptidase MepM/ murein hydrolase activator NlpD
VRGRAARAARVAPALAVLLAACAAPAPLPSLPPRPPPTAARPPPIPLAPQDLHDEPAVVGVVHVVRRGETLYRIARTYGIPLADLAETNGITDPRQVAVGTELFVPGATRVLEVPGATEPAPDPARSEGDAGAGSATTPVTPAEPPPGVAHPPPTPAAATARPPAHPAAAAHPATPTAPARPSIAPASVERPGSPKLAWPVHGVLYARYGKRAGQRHDGIDIAAPEGTAVTAAAAGKVIYVGEQAGYGSIVILRHDDGLVTLYAHTSRVLVEEGRSVRRGESIARVGQTGRTTGPHLHFEVREGTRPRNPLLYLP